jgi:hypothetical protein
MSNAMLSAARRYPLDRRRDPRRAADQLQHRLQLKWDNGGGPYLSCAFAQLVGDTPRHFLIPRDSLNYPSTWVDGAVGTERLCSHKLRSSQLDTLDAHPGTSIFAKLQSF